MQETSASPEQATPAGPQPAGPVGVPSDLEPVAALFPVGEYGLSVLPPVAALIELAVIVAVLLLVDWLYPALEIDDLQPSVYWLPVLLLSLQYGTASGSLAAIVAIASYFALSTLPDQGVGENEFAYRLRVLAQPILWIATAVFLGQFRMVQIAAKQELTRRVGELEAQGRTLADYATKLRRRCDVLERDIVARSLTQDPRLLMALARLRDKSVAPGPEIERCLAAVAPGGAASVFVRTQAGLSRAVSVGWPEVAPWSDLMSSQSVLATAIIGSKRPLSVLEAADDAALGGQGIAAAPVIDDANGRVIGMIKVELAPGAIVTSLLSQELAVLAQAIAPRLAEITHRSSGASNESASAMGHSINTVPLRPQSKLGIVAADDSYEGTGPTRGIERPWPKAGF